MGVKEALRKYNTMVKINPLTFSISKTDRSPELCMLGAGNSVPEYVCRLREKYCIYWGEGWGVDQNTRTMIAAPNECTNKLANERHGEKQTAFILLLYTTTKMKSRVSKRREQKSLLFLIKAVKSN